MPTNNPFDFSAFMAELDPDRMTARWQEMLKASPLAGLDLDALAESQRKNVESLMKANETAANGARDLLERQSAMMQQALTEATAAINEFSQSEPADALNKNAARVEESVRRSMDNFGEIATMMQESFGEISAQVEQRLQENLEELKRALNQND